MVGLKIFPYVANPPLYLGIMFWKVCTNDANTTMLFRRIESNSAKCQWAFQSWAVECNSWPIRIWEKYTLKCTGRFKVRVK